MKKVKLNKIMSRGKMIYLAYDQGLEHGPTGDFNDKNVDPLYIIEIAKKGKYNGVVFQKGIAEKYNEEIKASGIPLIVKLNGKTNLSKGEPISEPICTVEEAVKLGAKAVGFTIYIGSKHEAHMMKHFAKIEREAHKRGLPIITWIYPRGKGIEGKSDRELLSYAARVGLEIGADIVKLHWKGTPDDLKWAVKSAGRCKIVVAGGLKKSEKEFLQDVKKVISVGVSGLAVGRNIWQSDEPIELSRKIKKVVWS